MGKPKKKFQEGAAKTYITRSKAVKKLQVSIADFRRLCIFKGIYPREPPNRKKANKGKTTPNIFYYTKDIQYLLHEPIINKFREDKIFARKLSRALTRGEIDDAKRLDSNRPKHRLDNIVKERYPTFVDALRDLDDPLSMLFLFAIMPATDDVSFRVTQTANRLCHEWMAYVAREKLLRKVFVSIKGVYYQAVVRGQEVLWLVPFDFPQNVPSDVDFKVMLTFLEFYTTLTQFVLYRLYTETGIVYPPKVDEQKMKGVGGLSAFILHSREEDGAKSIRSLTSATAEDEPEQEEEEAKEEASTKSTATLSSAEIAKIAKEDAATEDVLNGSKPSAEDSEDEDDVENVQLDSFNTAENNSGDVLYQPSSDASASGVGNLFSNLVIFVGREVPAKIVEFLILSCGGKVILESALDEAIANEDVSSDKKAKKQALPDLSKVTHQISDRPTVPNKVPGRVYVQPQWVFDSINKATLLPISEYAPGTKLPPHLSPWGDRQGYDPEAELSEGEDDDEDSDEEEDEKEDEENDDEDEAKETREQQKELEKESSGVAYSENKKKAQDAAAAKKKGGKKRSKEEMEKEEEKALKIGMMSNRQKKKYDELQGNVDSKNSKTEQLKKKKRKIEAKLKAGKK